MYRFEICANSVASCLAAQEGGAHRVELCAGIPEGGTTPSYGMIRSARESISIGLNVTSGRHANWERTVSYSAASLRKVQWTWKP